MRTLTACLSLCALHKHTEIMSVKSTNWGHNYFRVELFEVCQNEAIPPFMLNNTILLFTVEVERDERGASKLTIFVKGAFLTQHSSRVNASNRGVNIYINNGKPARLPVGQLAKKEDIEIYSELINRRKHIKSQSLVFHVDLKEMSGYDPDNVEYFLKKQERDEKLYVEYLASGSLRIYPLVDDHGRAIDMRHHISSANRTSWDRNELEARLDKENTSSCSNTNSNSNDSFSQPPPTKRIKLDRDPVVSEKKVQGLDDEEQELHFVRFDMFAMAQASPLYRKCLTMKGFADSGSNTCSDPD